MIESTQCLLVDDDKDDQDIFLICIKKTGKNINCKIGTQTYSKDNIGYCTAISILYILDRLRYPELSRQQITRLHKSKPPEVVLNEIKILHHKLADIIPKLPFIEKKIHALKHIFNYDFNLGYTFVGFVKNDLFL